MRNVWVRGRRETKNPAKHAMQSHGSRQATLKPVAHGTAVTRWASSRSSLSSDFQMEDIRDMQTQVTKRGRSSSQELKIRLRVWTKRSLRARPPSYEKNVTAKGPVCQVWCESAAILAHSKRNCDGFAPLVDQRSIRRRLPRHRWLLRAPRYSRHRDSSRSPHQTTPRHQGEVPCRNARRIPRDVP